MKKLTIFLTSLLCTITISAQNLYIYKTDGTVYGNQMATIDSINFSTTQDSIYVHRIDRINRYAVSEVDSLSFTPPTNTTDTGVVINGVRWATRNVGTPGTFATAAEDAGMLYQWDSKVGWPSTGAIGSITATNGTKTWNSSWIGGYADDPSPAGWRVPTSAEITSLCNTAKVTRMWTTQKGVNGMNFTDKTTGATLFLPASGRRISDDGTLSSAGWTGYYWSSTVGKSSSAYNLIFGSNYAYQNVDDRANGFAVRLVLK